MTADGEQGRVAVEAVCEASLIKRRRSTRAEIDRRRDDLVQIVAGMKPMTVRQVYYQAVVRGIVAKTEAGYARVQTDLVWMRRAGVLPYDWLADTTRWQRRPRTFDSVGQALADTARFYRKRLWKDAGVYVEVWLEKDALAGVVFPITSVYDVPLMVARGYASLSFLHSAADAIGKLSVPARVYHLGDFDPSGVDVGVKIERALKEMAPDSEIHFEQLAVTPEQISAWDLPARPTKASDPRSKKFGNISVELDAIEPSGLRDLVETAVLHHLRPAQFKVLKAAEDSERALIAGLVGMVQQSIP